MSATGEYQDYEDQDYVDALLVECGLKGCAAPPGEPCVNLVSGVDPRDKPHLSRVVKSRRTNDGRSS